jgi:hypothetical protein
MPTYNFLNIDTGEEFESFMKISEREKYLLENTHIHPVMTAPAIVSGVSSSKQNRVPDGFKEVLSKIAEGHPASEVAANHSAKSIKQAKTERVVKKHLKE